jgi:PAS domain S-box-containing protein
MHIGRHRIYKGCISDYIFWLFLKIALHMSVSNETKLARLERILESTSEGWWEWDVETNATFHSPGWYKMLGLMPDDSASTYKLWLELVHPDDRARVNEDQRIFINRQKPWEQEFRMRHAKGYYIWILSRGCILTFGADNRPKLAGGVHINITDQRRQTQLREELKFKEDLIEGIMKVSQSSITMMDFIAKRMSFTNGHIAKKMGYNVEEIAELSENFYESVIHPEDKPKLQQHLNKLIESTDGQTFECMLRFRAKDGTYNSISLRDSVFERDENGYPREVIFSAIDVTRYVKLKSQLIENVKLIEEMSFKNSHEMRGPVATMLGLVNLIKIEMPTQATAMDLVNYLEKTVLKMDEVIRELTDFLNDRLNKNN